MAQVQKFLFETAFDAEAQQAAAAERERTPPPSFSAEDLAEAREQGFAAGRSAGLEEAAQGTEHVAAQALATVAARLEDMTGQLATTCEDREHQAVETAVMLLRKLFPELSRRNALTEIMAAIGQCLEQLRDEPRVVVRIAETLLDPLRERLEGLVAGAGYDGKIVLLADEALPVGDVRVEWADGGLERDTARLWAEIDEILERAVGGPRAGSPGQSAAAPTTTPGPAAETMPAETGASDSAGPAAKRIDEPGART